MDFVTIEELAKASGKSRRTIDRKIQALEKENPDEFIKLVRRPSEGKRILYHPQILLLIGLSDEVIEGVKKEISETTVISKPRDKKTKVSKPTVIAVGAQVDGVEKDLADFNLIMEDYKTGEWTLIECIDRNNIRQHVFFYWINTRPAFNQMYLEVYELHKRSFNILMREMGKMSLRKLVTGYEKTVESVTYKELISPTGQSIKVPMERKTYQKHIIPNTNAVVFALTNRDPDEWKRFWNPNDQEKGRIADPLEQMGEDELFQIVDEAKKQGLLTQGDLTNATQL